MYNISGLLDRQKIKGITCISSSTLWKLTTLISSDVSEEAKLSFQCREVWKQSNHLEGCYKISWTKPEQMSVTVYVWLKDAWLGVCNQGAVGNWECIGFQTAEWQGGVLGEKEDVTGQQHWLTGNRYQKWGLLPSVRGEAMWKSTSARKNPHNKIRKAA